jgi:hypothetical protein
VCCFTAITEDQCRVFCRTSRVLYEEQCLKADSHIPCRFHAVPLPCRSFPFDLHSAAVFDSHIPWHGMCESALCVNQTRPHCVNQMGKIQSKPLAERHGRGWQGNGMVCVNPPLIVHQRAAQNELRPKTSYKETNLHPSRASYGRVQVE